MTKLRVTLSGIKKALKDWFALGGMINAPCKLCGYSGANYYQPNFHPCAEFHHKYYKPQF